MAGLTDPHVEVADTTGTDDHFSAVIISDDFKELSLIEQHQLVYKTLGNNRRVNNPNGPPLLQ
ncbi:MAG: BolA/IbaG family iron-sulfur metabolism protein [Nitrospirota bacterium]|nr:BolA/IbaG family iron-sulfur metabolism protein [Nitrospirota bacterium]